MMLELRNIYKTYEQGKLEVPVLKNISLSVEEGEYVAIMGPSGSGKTTLMNIIGCLDSPTSGAYLLEGEDISHNSDAKMSEVRLHSIGFVFQSFYLLSRQSALENVALPLLYAGVHRGERLDIARKALERVGLGDRTDFKPTQLSGGQCQRVAIARAIVNNPKILLADEPTGALDTKSGEQIMEIFHRLNDEGVTIVMITHEPEIAAHAQRILHIRDGRLMDEHGNFITPEEPQAEADTLPEDVIPVKEFLAAPLDARLAQADTPIAPVEAPPTPAKTVEIDSIFLSPDAPQAVDPAAEAGTPDEPLEPSGTPETAGETMELETAVPEAEDCLSREPEIPETVPQFLQQAEEEVPLAYEEDTPPAADDETAETFLDAEISALLDGEIAHWDELSGEEFSVRSSQPSPVDSPELSAELPAEESLDVSADFAFPAGEPDPSRAWEDMDGFDISQVSQAIDLEESGDIPGTEESAGVPEQLFFDVWGVGEGASAPKTLEEAPGEGPAPLPDSALPSETAVPIEEMEAGPWDVLEEQTSFEEDFFAEASKLPEAPAVSGSFDAPASLDADLTGDFPVQAAPEEETVSMEDTGRFSAPIRTELDLSSLPFAKHEDAPAAPGGFEEPIKIELNGLGLDDPPKASADKGDEA